jgi:hypothetical protein
MGDNLRKISINLDSLKIPGNVGGGTRKKRPPAEKKFKIKAPPKPHTKSLKRNLLKFIRNQQDQKLKNIVEKPEATDDFKTDFNTSIAYLSEVSKKTENEAKVKNRTLKHYEGGAPTMLTNILGVNPIVPITLDVPTQSMSYRIPPPPQYGCLKGGKLPLYKQYTRKNYGSLGVPIQVNNFQAPPTMAPTSMAPTTMAPTTMAPTTMAPTTMAPVPPPRTTTPSISKVQQISKTTNFFNSKYKPPASKKQRKTLRRTYNVGKSKNIPRVSVLISNKTIRNNISTKSQLLKQTPIQEVKRYLVKNGFIKIGSIAPNDVLRKMYETASLVCGEIHNYSPENLVYNFFNAEKGAN